MTQSITSLANEKIFGIRHLHCFSADECQRIIESATEDLWRAGTHSAYSGKDRQVADTGYRSVSMQPLSSNKENWPMETILNNAYETNDKYYKFELAGLLPNIDYPTLLKYEDNKNGHYGWHLDFSGGFSTRKLTFSIQLSEPSEYDGCDLEFAPPPPKVTFGPDSTFETIRQSLRQQGKIIIFPSYLLHRVTPITRGTRYAIVGWIHGPTFK